MPRPTRRAALAEQPRACSDTSGMSCKELTRPQKRRKRMQLLAAHNALAMLEDNTQSRSAKSGANVQRVECYDRLACVESLVCQIHWQLIGQYIQEQPCDTDLSGSGDKGLVKTCSTFDASAQTFVPEVVEGPAVWENVLRCLGSSEPADNGDKLGIETNTDCWEPVPVTRSCETRRAAEQHYSQWHSQSKTIFANSASFMREELRTEAAVVLQRWFRSCLRSTSSCASLADEESSEETDCDNDDANSQANLVVRRAFMASIYSGQAVSAVTDAVDDHWSMEEVTLWIDRSLDSVLKTEDRISGARSFWCEWAAVEHHFPAKLRNGIIKLLDKKIQTRGVPSLRELVGIQDGGSNL